MTYLIGFGLFLLGFFGALFALSNVLLPLLYSLPRLREEKKKGSFKTDPPASSLYGLILLWLIIFAVLSSIVVYFLQEYMIAYFVGALLALIGIVKKLRDRSPDLEEDFRDRFEEYWK
jgi:uncharacterized BrkB/YihY/UPF0761 family membrane protein